MSGKAAYLRAGGQLVRHLVPPQLPLADSYADPAAVAKLIFPRYRPDSPTPLEALERHAQTDPSERPLPSNDVEFLLSSPASGDVGVWKTQNRKKS